MYRLQLSNWDLKMSVRLPYFKELRCTLILLLNLKICIDGMYMQCIVTAYFRGCNRMGAYP